VPASGPRLSAKQERTPAGDGIFPTSKWRPGEFVKETFKLRIPPQSPDALSFGIRVLDAARKPAALPNGETQIVLGSLPVTPPGPWDVPWDAPPCARATPWIGTARAWRRACVRLGAMRATAIVVLAVALPAAAQTTNGILVVGSVIPDPAQLGGPVSF